MLKIGFTKIGTEESMYKKLGKDGKCQAIMLIYADDILVTSSTSNINKYFKILQQELTIGGPGFLNEKMK